MITVGTPLQARVWLYTFSPAITCLLLLPGLPLGKKPQCMAIVPRLRTQQEQDFNQDLKKIQHNTKETKNMLCSNLP